MFWTGGWDSTFMLIQELRKGKEIQPIYVIDNKRKGNDYEIKAMDTITKKLEQRNYLGGKLHNLIFIDKDSIEILDEVENAFNVIHKETNLGIQHEWLSSYALKENISIMLGTENGTPETSHIIYALNKYCKLTKKDDVQVVDEFNSSKEGNYIFGKMIFPIIDLYETDMVKRIKEWNLEDIMNNIWFCHTPINGKPCGLCHPCEVKMESDMQFLLPEKAQKRYFTIHKLKNRLFKKVYKKICFR